MSADTCAPRAPCLRVFADGADLHARVVALTCAHCPRWQWATCGLKRRSTFVQRTRSYASNRLLQKPSYILCGLKEALSLSGAMGSTNQLAPQRGPFPSQAPTCRQCGASHSAFQQKWRNATSAHRSRECFRTPVENEHSARACDCIGTLRRIPDPCRFQPILGKYG